MNRAKLTPCRKVGLSRKKSTPSRTVDSFLTERNITRTTPVSIKQEQNCVTPSTFSQNFELNYDTPCRQVGLSRKRKTMTPLGDIKTNRSVSTTPSLPSLIVNSSCKENMFMDVNNKKYQNQVRCTIPLSEQLSLGSTPYIDELNKLEKSVLTGDILMSKDESNTRIRETFVEYDEKKEVAVELNGHNEKYITATSESNSVVEDFKFDSKSENEFIKVCYKDKKVDSMIKSMQNTKTKNMCVTKKSKFNRKIFDDYEDDFEVSTKKIKSKNKFGRYETDVASLQKRVLNKKSVPLKKSLSVGDKCKIASTLSTTVSESSITDCFVKLTQIENLTKKSPDVLKSQELSDDDFDMFTSTPPNIKSIINDLEKQVKEKKNILEELERAKIYRKLHNIKELKTLTLTWENGCKLALTDLLEQLNTHTEMSMDMLLKKLNIPEDFMSLSQ